MRAKPEYRNREETEVAVLDALADRRDEGMTVFELRSEVGRDIDTIEEALADLKADGLIETSREEDRLVIVPKSHVIESRGSNDDDEDFFEKVRRRLPF